MNTLRTEFETSCVDAGFKALAALAYQEAGLVLSEKKSAMIRSRLRHRLRALNLNNLEQYCEFVTSDSQNDERRKMISALTTNVTDFFREKHHFDFLKEKLVPKMKEKLQNGKKVRIWSAGCSKGQEPYSIAFLLLNEDPAFSNADCKILATDIDHEVLAVAQNGIYEPNQLTNLDQRQIEQFFESTTSGGTELWQVRGEVKKMVSFRELNLLDTWPMQGKFDVIFCRNVVIYFDNDTQLTLWPKFASKLHSDGTIFVGHSERINSEEFVTCGATTYKLASEDNKIETKKDGQRAENGIA